MSAQDISAEVIAAQFAGGRRIAQLAEEWEIDAGLVEAAIRTQFRLMIPRRDGGLKASRSELREERSEERQAVRRAQTTLGW